MKTSPYFTMLFCTVVLLAIGCKKDDSPQVSIDVDVHDPVITTTIDGKKKIDFVIEVTQLGNYFCQDFDLEFSKYGSTTVLDKFHTLMPTAREFVRHSIIVAAPGQYFVTATVSSEFALYSSTTSVEVPE